MSNFLSFILIRLKEKSTWRGILAVATALGVTFSPEQSAQIIALGLALIGTINVFRKEAPKETPTSLPQ